MMNNSIVMQPLDAYRNSGALNHPHINAQASNSMLLDRSSNISAFDKSGDHTPLKLKSQASTSLTRPTGNQAPLSANNTTYVLNAKKQSQKFKQRRDSNNLHNDNTNVSHNHTTLVDTLS